MDELTNAILATIRRAIALQLWELGAVKVNLERPYKLVSGSYSPIYINCRQLICSPAFADLFACAARTLCAASSVEFDVIAGGETAGIPFAAFLARAFGTPMAYVRKATKDHGLSSLVEGSPPPGQRVLLVEDLITDAGSKMQFIDALRGTGSTVTDVLVVFDRLQGGREALEKTGIRLHTTTDMDVVMAAAIKARLLTEEQAVVVGEYLKHPKTWQPSLVQ